MIVEDAKQGMRTKTMQKDAPFIVDGWPDFFAGGEAGKSNLEIPTSRVRSCWPNTSIHLVK
jgi:hypothetical protein